MKLLLFLSLTFVFIQAISAQTSQDAGKYIVYVGNTVLADEIYSSNRQADGAIRTESLVVAGGKPTEFGKNERRIVQNFAKLG